MVTVVTREANGIPLTHDQVDDNFTNLAAAVNSIGADVIAEAVAAKDVAVGAANSASASANSAANSANAASISSGSAADSAEQAANSAAASAEQAAAFALRDGSSLIGFSEAQSADIIQDVESRLREIPSISAKGAVDGPLLDQTSAIDACENDTYHDVFYAPLGTYNTSRFTLKKRYVGPGIVRTGWVNPALMTANPVVQEPSWHPSQTWAVNRPAIVLSPAMRTAYNSGLITGVWLGDSISEAIDVAYGNSLCPMFYSMLETQLPNCKIDLTNLSLLGRSMDNLANSAFVAGDPATTQPNAAGSFWRSSFPHTDGISNASGADSVLRNDIWPVGSTIGKSWLNHARDLSPDFLVIALGTNNFGNESGFNAAFQAIVAATATWTKIPFLILATPAKPSAVQQPAALVPTQAIADSARGIAVQKGYGLIDANEASRVVLDGVSVQYAQRLRERNFNGWSNGALWNVGSGMAYSQVGSAPGYFGVITATASPSLSIRKVRARDVDISALFTFAGTDAVPFFTLRSSSDVAAHAGILVRLEGNGATLRVYNKESPIYTAATGLTVGASGTVRLRVKVTGALLEVWVGNAKLINRSDFGGIFWAGSLGFGFDAGSGSLSQCEFEYAPDLRQSTDICDEYEVFGPPPGMGGSTIGYRDDSQFYGGDGIHHPSSLGLEKVYTSAIARCVFEIVRELTKTYPVFKSIFTTDTNTTGASKKIAGSTVSVLGLSSSNSYPSLAEFSISLPYSNSSTLGSLSLYSGTEDAPVAALRSWYLQPSVSNQQFSVNSKIPIGPGPQSFHLRWNGAGLSAGASLFPIEISATIFN